MLSKRHGTTGHDGVSCLHYLRSSDPPLNPMECEKIQREFGLHNERDAVLELAKGKLTTDPVNHSGEGIFFTSRMFDVFFISSGTAFFFHSDDDDQFGDWALESETRKEPKDGTGVIMKITNASSRTTKEVFDRFT